MIKDKAVQSEEFKVLILHKHIVLDGAYFPQITTPGQFANINICDQFQEDLRFPHTLFSTKIQTRVKMSWKNFWLQLCE